MSAKLPAPTINTDIESMKETVLLAFALAKQCTFYRWFHKLIASEQSAAIACKLFVTPCKSHDTPRSQPNVLSSCVICCSWTRNGPCELSGIQSETCLVCMCWLDNPVCHSEIGDASIKLRKFTTSMTLVCCSTLTVVDFNRVHTSENTTTLWPWNFIKGTETADQQTQTR